MLDINFIRKNPEIVKKAVTDKDIDLDVDKLLKLDVKRRQLIVKVDELRRQRNQAAKDRDVEKGKQIKQELDTWDIELKEADTRFNHMMLFVPNIPAPDSPLGLTDDALLGSGLFPFGKENIYQIANPGKLHTGEDIKRPLYLTGTSESSLLAYYMDEVIPESKLPIKICAMTHCYRSEVGDYGKDTRGLYRVHEFDKVEQLVICQSDLNESEDWFGRMQQYSEQILQELKLPYRVINVCTGDMGAGKYKMYDIETWMPSRQSYGETHSNSNLTDWQARRLNLKVRSKDRKTVYPYTLNNTVIASPRILIAILENFQQADGSVKIPEALIPYTNFKDLRPK